MEICAPSHSGHFRSGAKDLSVRRWEIVFGFQPGEERRLLMYMLGGECDIDGHTNLCPAAREGTGATGLGEGVGGGLLSPEAGKLKQSGVACQIR